MSMTHQSTKRLSEEELLGHDHLPETPSRVKALPSDDAVELLWNDVKYSVSLGGCCGFRAREKKILHGVHGRCQPGQMLAIIGSSGAGKTTMLHCLAGRVSGKVEGEIVLNGLPATTKRIRSRSGFVIQDDMMFPHLTVQETLTYAVELRCPMSLGWKEKRARVDSAIEKLGLEHVRHNIVGDAIVRGLSGGERKRVAIAQEMVTNPPLLFLDEPTSGLDSQTALGLMRQLSMIAKRDNHTIICTIHQPRSQIFNQFDSLLLLAKGKPVYFGAVREAVPYFSRLGYPCPQFENAADYLIDLVSVDLQDKEASEERRDELIDAYRPPDDFTATTVQESAKSDPSEFKSTWFNEFLWLFHRASTNFVRDRTFIAVRVIQTLVFTGVVGVLYFQMDNNQTSIGDRRGLLILCLMNVSFNELMAVLGTFPKERPIINRERLSGAFRISSYYCAKQLADLPIQLCAPLLFSTILYWSTGLQPDFIKFVLFCTIVVTLGFVANSLGLLMTALLPVESAAVLAPLAVLANALLAGFFVAKDSMPVFLRWATYTSFLKYAFEAVIINEFEGQDFECDSDELIHFKNCNSTTVCPITNGDQVVDELDNGPFGITEDIIVLICGAVCLRVLVYFALRFRKLD